jgi:ABC-2 type transport system permease protein
MWNKLAAIIGKDTRLRFESRSELLFFLVLPLVFTFIVGGGIPDGEGDERFYVPVVDEDGGARAAEFLTALGRSEAIRPEATTRSDADALLDGGDVGAVLVVPAGFGDALAADATGDAAEIVVRAAPGSNVGLLVEQEARRAAGEVARPLLVARNATRGVESVQPFTDEAARTAFFENTLAAATTEVAAQPARVVVVPLGNETEDGYDPNAQASAGQLITWVFIPLLAASGLFVAERTLGTLRRLMVTPTSKSTFLLGSIGGQFLMALVQMALLVLFGVFVMRVPWGQAPLALVVTLVTFGLAGVALGTTLGTFVKTESQAGNLSIMLGMVMALFGGAWWPMELFPPTLQQVVKVLPTTWAMQAMTDITMRGGGLAEILPEAAVLMGFAVVFFAVGVWRFRYE